MKPTAYVLLVVSLLLAVSAVLTYMTPDPFASNREGLHGMPWGSSTLMFALFIAAGVAAVLAWAILRFGGKGYTETSNPLQRR